MNEQIKEPLKQNGNKKKIIIFSAVLLILFVFIYILYLQGNNNKSNNNQNSTFKADYISYTIREKENIDKIDALISEGEIIDTSELSNISERIELVDEILEISQYKCNPSIALLSLAEDKSADAIADTLAESNYFCGITASSFYMQSYDYYWPFPNYQEALNKIRAAIEKVEDMEEIQRGVSSLNKRDDVEPGTYFLVGAGVKKAEYLAHQGNIYRGLEEYTLSIQSFKDSINLWPREAKVYVGFGLTYEENGQHSLAKEQWGKALELNPDNAEAKAFLER